MKKYKMLFTGDYQEEWFKQFEKFFEIERAGYGLSKVAVMSVMDENNLIDALQGKEVLLDGYDRINERVLSHCPDLKVIMSVRDGPEENIDIEACTKHGIPVISSAGRCSVSVSEFTILLMLLLARPMFPVMQKMRNEGWTNDNNSEMRLMHATRSTELFNKTLGIIGFGRNAKKLAPLAKAFNMIVNAYDPYVDSEEMLKYGVNKYELNELVRTSDYIVVLARLTKDTEKILNRDLIYSMKHTASIINISRGKLIDNEAVFDALRENVIRSAALDVYEHEPTGSLQENLMYDIPSDKLLLTPHAAGNTLERPWHQYDLLYSQLIDYFKGNIPEGIKNRNVFNEAEFENKGKKLFGVLE